MLHNINKSLKLTSESKQNPDFYKELSKKAERYKPLPKLKFNSKEHAGLYDPSYQSVDYSYQVEDDHPVVWLTLF